MSVKNMKRKIINHKWQCECGIWISEDYDECPICKYKKQQEQAKEKNRKEIMKNLKKLTPREQKILIMRFGLKDGMIRTLEEIGKKFGVSRERIRQIEAKALEKIRKF